MLIKQKGEAHKILIRLIDNVYLSDMPACYMGNIGLTQEPSVTFGIMATDSVWDSDCEIRTVLIPLQPTINVG